MPWPWKPLSHVGLSLCTGRQDWVEEIQSPADQATLSRVGIVLEGRGDSGGTVSPATEQRGPRAVCAPQHSSPHLLCPRWTGGSDRQWTCVLMGAQRLIRAKLDFWKGLFWKGLAASGPGGGLLCGAGSH